MLLKIYFERMKKLLFVTLLLLLTVSCSRKGNNTISDYVVDTTLTRYYPEVFDSLSTYIPEHWSGDEVPTAEIAYKVVEPMIKNFLGKKKMNSQKPFRINHVDSVWYIMSSFPDPITTKEGIIWGTPTVYIEIRKNDGRVISFVVDY